VISFFSFKAVKIFWLRLGELGLPDFLSCVKPAFIDGAAGFLFQVVE
jgi:hypothetical protein